MDDVEVRVGDAERWAADARLQQAVGDGQLTLVEYEERSGAVWQARTRGELDATVRDLPAAPPAPAAPPPVRSLRPRRAIAVMSGDELRGPVAPGQGVEAYALMGGSVVDLRTSPLPHQVHVRAVAVMGGIEILVPRGVEVHLSGLAVMSGRDVKVEASRPGAPVVTVSAWALMGGVEVKHGKGAPEVDGGALETGTAAQPLVPGQSAPVVAPAPASAAERCGSVALPGHGSVRHRRARRFGASAWLVALVLGGGWVATQSDTAAVFSSSTYVVTGDQDREVDAGTLFGSVRVVVPEGARVTTGGVVVFGSTESDVPGGGDGPTIEVDSIGAFGSVEVVTQRQLDDARAAEAAEEAAEDAREAAEDARDR